MTFADVERDIHKLIGLELNSINHGAAITIERIDDEQSRIILKSKNGKLRSRPMSELQRIWEAMQKAPAVHVDQVLNGSGTSRNQPETILANLPYVEWLRVDNKKHIAFVGQNTHPFGTLEEMNSLAAAEIAEKLELLAKKRGISAVVVSQNVKESIACIQAICSGNLSALDQGVYQVETKEDLFIFMSSETTGLEEGTYCVIELHEYPIKGNTKEIFLLGHKYIALCTDDIKLLLREWD